MNLLKKLYPFTIVIAFIFYGIIIEELTAIALSGDVNLFLFFRLIIPLIGVGLGIVLDLSSRNLAPLGFKIKLNYLIIAFIFAFILYSPYTLFSVTVLNFFPFLIRPISAQTPYILAILIGFFLSKGLLRSLE
ncbi:hypothetical protein [Acetobacterium bakii]|uniref:hypothetical protein n=1 Tax=Acetobacterium bakii TaxID=52689 RepID=UPI000F8CCC19|nr:hypothetical protein [Acetobacterium bakii]